MDDAKFHVECQRLLLLAQSASTTAAGYLIKSREELASTQARAVHPLRRLLMKRWSQREIQRLSESVARDEEHVAHTREIVQRTQGLPRRLEGPRARRASQEAARAEARLALQELKTHAYTAALRRLTIDREALVIRPQDYRRGNAIDNHCRAKWTDRIAEAYMGKCFLCTTNLKHR